MTERVKVALIGAIAPTIAAAAIILTGQVNHATNGKKLDVIHDQTNSTLTTANARITALEDTIKALVAQRVAPK